ncbi:MAG: 50S ribosomal protein L13 [Nanoarchaeota archaeon]|nr:50S ribosomal protein L13 [Nanoarchaeota archaeon]
MIIDATNLILGRIASFAAKNALLGKDIQIINCENAVVTGNKKTTLKHYTERLARGSRTRGPFTLKRPDMFVKRTIRGMLDKRTENGKRALKKIRCYISVPSNLQDKKSEKMQGMDISKLEIVKYIKVNEICKQLGGRI